MLKREDILGAAPRVETVNVPEWGGDVAVRPLTAGELWKWQDAWADEKRRHSGEAAALLVALSLCDDAGAALFTEEDVPALMRMPSAALAAVWSAALRVNRLDKPAQDALAGN